MKCTISNSLFLFVATVQQFEFPVLTLYFEVLLTDEPEREVNNRLPIIDDFLLLIALIVNTGILHFPADRSQLIVQGTLFKIKYFTPIYSEFQSYRVKNEIGILAIGVCRFVGDVGRPPPPPSSLLTDEKEAVRSFGS